MKSDTKVLILANATAFLTLLGVGSLTGDPLASFAISAAVFTALMCNDVSSQGK